MHRSYFGETSSSDDLHQRSLRGGAVSMVAQGTTMAVQVLSTIVLARLLVPEDFGLVAMVAAITGFATVFVDLGTRDALSQREQVTEGEVSALFWINVSVGVTLTAAAMLCSGLIARLYGEPRLVYVTIAMSFTFVFPSLYYAQYALMRRALLFRELAVVDVSANVLSTAITVFLAVDGYDYWALVARPVLKELLAAIGIWAVCGWYPRRPTFTPAVRDMLRFGLNIIGFSMADYVARSADRVALGYTTGPSDLGHYQNALVIYDNPLTLFTMPLHSVAVSTLSKLRGDLDQFKRAWSAALSSLVFFAAPAFALLAAAGQDLVVVLLGSKWAQSGAILTIFALRGPAQVVERTVGWLHVAAGRADRWRHYGLVSCGLFLVALCCGLPFGPAGVATSYAVCMYLLFVPAILYAGKPLGIGARDLMQSVGPQVVVALVIAFVGLVLRRTVFADMSPVERLFLLSAICGGGYLAIMIIGFRMTRPIQLALQLLSRRRHAAS